MILLCCAKSTRGKSTLVKRIIEKIQPKHAPYMVIIITDHPQEDFGDLKINKNTTLQLCHKEDIDNVIDIIFKPELIDIYKIIFVDDSTSMDGKHTNNMLKLFTQARHQNCDVIFANHYINNLHINIKAHISDFAIWGPISQSKLQPFYNDICSDNLDCIAPGHEMNYDIFKTQFYNKVQRDDIPRDSVEQDKYYHNYAYISFPTVYDKTSQYMFNDFTLKNSVLNSDKFKDQKPDEQQLQKYMQMVIDDNIVIQDKAIQDPVKYMVDKQNHIIDINVQQVEQYKKQRKPRSDKGKSRK